MKKTELILPIIWFIAGALCISLSSLGIISDIWTGFGGGLVVVAIIRIIHYIRMRHNAELLEQETVEKNDERNIYIRTKAWSWAGYAMIILSGILCILFMIIGNNLLMQVCSYYVCLTIIFYWIAYLILKKKY